MSKRPPQNNSHEMDNSRKRKRPNTFTSAGPSVDITTAKQLESLLGDLSSQEGLEKGKMNQLIDLGYLIGTQKINT